MDKKQRMDGFCSALTKKFGVGVIKYGTELQLTERYKRIDTGSVAWNYALGGGIQVGRMHELWGGRSTGKTSQACRILANAQKNLCANCYDPFQWKEIEPGASGPWCDCYQKGIFTPCPLPNEDKETFKARVERYKANSYEPVFGTLVDVEFTFDMDWGLGLGLDPNNFLLSQHESGEEAIDVVQGLIEHGGSDIIILDSIAQIVPSGEADESVAKQFQALQPRLINRAFRMWGNAMSKLWKNHRKFVTLLLINQVRMKTGVMFGDPKTKPGGQAQGFYVSTETFFYGKKIEKNTIESGNKGEGIEVPLRSPVGFTVEKNKTGAPHIEGEFLVSLHDDGFLKAGQIDEYAYVWRKAIHLGLIKTEGAGVSKKAIILLDKNKNEYTVLLSEVKDFILKNPDVWEKIRECVLEKMIEISDNYKPEYKFT